MKRTCLILFAVLLAAQQAEAHGLAIEISLLNNRLHAAQNTYTSSLGLVPDFDYETDSPGITVLSAGSKIPNGTAFKFNVVDNLFYWNGSALAPAPTTFTFENAAAQGTNIDKNTIFSTTSVIGTYNINTVGWHEHPFYAVPLNAAAGAYGIVVTITGQNLAYSDPVLLVFNRGLTTAQFNLGVTAMQKTQFGPLGDINLDGLTDGADYTIWANHFQHPGTLSEGDLNRDGVVDGADYTIWANNFSSKSAALPVPEPGTLLLAVTGLLAVLGLGHRWKKVSFPPMPVSLQPGRVPW